MIKARSNRYRATQDAYAIIVAHLVTWPADATKLVELSGLHHRIVKEFLRSLYRRGALYIVAWRKDARGAVRTPVFALKIRPSDKDAEKELKTRAEITRDYRARKRLTNAQNLRIVQHMDAAHGAKRE
jgi:hypothetical protein